MWQFYFCEFRDMLILPYPIWIPQTGQDQTSNKVMPCSFKDTALSDFRLLSLCIKCKHGLELPLKTSSHVRTLTSRNRRVVKIWEGMWKFTALLAEHLPHTCSNSTVDSRDKLRNFVREQFSRLILNLQRRLIHHPIPITKEKKGSFTTLSIFCQVNTNLPF